jgi:hypothetical protein
MVAMRDFIKIDQILKIVFGEDNPVADLRLTLKEDATISLTLEGQTITSCKLIELLKEQPKAATSILPLLCSLDEHDIESIIGALGALQSGFTARAKKLTMKVEEMAGVSDPELLCANRHVPIGRAIWPQLEEEIENSLKKLHGARAALEETKARFEEERQAYLAGGGETSDPPES